MAKRLGGKSRRVDESLNTIDRLLVWQIPSVERALVLGQRPVYTGHSKNDDTRQLVLRSGLLRPPAEVLANLVGRSDVMIDDAIARKPALARRTSWTRDEDGMFADAALVAIGDDRPCFNRRRRLLAETAGERRKRIVISTDSNHTASVDMAAAVIATIRIVQQWQPIEVWWQGAWLSPDRTRGYVFHVPLIEGDMDFSKIMFFLASSARDSFSWLMMATESVARGFHGWGGCQHQAERSYLPDTDHFIDHDGIRPPAVEGYAAHFLGLPSAWGVEYEGEQNQIGALQEIKAPREYKAETAEERRKREEQYADYEKRRKAEDARRAADRGLN